ncbi:MAG: TlyA family RNA methyltransferase [Bacteroidales bacterium]
MRLDVSLVKQQIFSSREVAKFNILKGHVAVNGKVAKKPSQYISETDSIELVGEPPLPYVSKGGLKLHKAIKEFGIDCSHLNALDVGASTGGFTDCLLKLGASCVYATDVGTNQLAKELKDDGRVISIENINIKNLLPEHVDKKKFNLIVTDLSFISLTKVIEFFPKFLQPDGIVVALIKPQFEVGSESISKGGIVKDKKAHATAIINIAQESAKHKLFLKSLTWSPIVSASKNIEYLSLFTKELSILPDINQTVKLAFKQQKELLR